ncbi:hypothetical protein N8I77_002572 [Diaporthe amygdali]|uniref:Uncharacterized protein n=1 Tax=Phomopsis amygdali TaxID=1214568 RepID=A0AAD9SUF8_PHOAM|nr:hypothetical protein N8I77_002572 [Diaporthe amygdali]
MKLILVAAALSAVSYAQLDMAKITDCSALDNECRTGADANMATCSAANAQCKQCQIDYNQCRAPGNGVSGNQAGCAAQVVACVGSAYPSLSASTTTSDSSDDCQSTYKSCVAGGTSEELCGCDLATCTGEDNARTRDYCAALSSSSAVASATATATAAATASGSSDDCQSTWKACVAGGKSEELCNCDLATCTGEDNARTRAYCATLSAGLATASATGGSSAATGLVTSGAPRPTASAGGVGSNSTSSTPIVTGAAASVGFSIFGAASAFVSYLLL